MTDQTEDLTLLGQSGVKPPDSPDQADIETFKNTHPNRDYSITFHCPEFTAVCPITGQPDFGTITIEYIPGETCIGTFGDARRLFPVIARGLGGW